MRTVGEIISATKTRLISVGPDDAIVEALNVMAANNLGAIVVAEEDRLVGIFSERDFTRKVLLAKKSADQTKVRDAMTADVLSVAPEMGAEECLSQMNRRGVRHMPVVSNGRLVGVLSILQVVDAVLTERDLMINHLENYVSETWPL